MTLHHVRSVNTHNQPTHQLRMLRNYVFLFQCSLVLDAKIEDADQSARMRRLIGIFLARTYRKISFHAMPIISFCSFMYLKSVRNQTCTVQRVRAGVGPSLFLSLP